MTLAELRKRISGACAKNILIPYRGGGYEGCAWEWNAAYFDSWGDFNAVYATGRDGQTTLSGMLSYLAEEERCGSENAYDIYERGAMEEFGRTYNAGFVLGVGIWLNRHGEETFCATCKTCHVRLPIECMTRGDIESAGGIEVQATALLCKRCKADEETLWNIEIENEDGTGTEVSHFTQKELIDAAPYFVQRVLSPRLPDAHDEEWLYLECDARLMEETVHIVQVKRGTWVD